MKRLIICCDGTWNSADQQKNGQLCPTNVIKLATRLANRDDAGVLQVIFYDQGVGTGNATDRWTGGAFGRGLEDNILDGYRFLVGNYERGDEIYLFGFSRGAYTARSLAGMVRKCGLLSRNSVGRYLQAIELYRGDEDVDGPAARSFRTEYAIGGDQPIPIKLIGVWDTVGALGIPLRGMRWVTRKKYRFHDVQLSRSVEYAYQALAIDERRAPFRPTLWHSDNPNVEQVWFAGVHSDVGGGYMRTGLSDIALDWMIEKVAGVGLSFDRAAMERRPLSPDHRMEPHNSKTGLYRVTVGDDREIGMRPVNPADPQGPREPDATQSLHSSVLLRLKDCPEWRPKALTRYLEKNPPE